MGKYAQPLAGTLSANGLGFIVCQFAQATRIVHFCRVEKPWHVLYVAPRCEFAVADELRADNHDALVPIIESLKRVSRHAKRKELITFPRFSQYVFFRLSGPADLRGIRGAQYVLGFGEQPASISDAEVQALRRQQPLRAGDHVEAVTTSAVGNVGLVLFIANKRADVSFIGHAKIMNLPLDVLRAA